MIRIFDRNKDGYINKKEFKMMTTASKFSMKKIETVFAVSFKVYQSLKKVEHYLQYYGSSVILISIELSIYVVMR